MTYQTTITKKGQVTIPKPFRDMLKLNKFRKIVVEIDQKKKILKMAPATDFLEVARKITVKRKNPLLARGLMEKKYVRR